MISRSIDSDRPPSSLAAAILYRLPSSAASSAGVARHKVCSPLALRMPPLSGTSRFSASVRIARRHALRHDSAAYSTLVLMPSTSATRCTNIQNNDKMTSSSVLPFWRATSTSTLRNRGRPSSSSSQAWITVHSCHGSSGLPIDLANSITWNPELVSGVSSGSGGVHRRGSVHPNTVFGSICGTSATSAVITPPPPNYLHNRPNWRERGQVDGDVRRPPSGKNPAGGVDFCCSLCSPLCDWSWFDACLWFTDCEVAGCAGGHEVAGVVPRFCSALCVVNAVSFAGADARQCELTATSVGDSVGE